MQKKKAAITFDYKRIKRRKFTDVYTNVYTCKVMTITITTLISQTSNDP